MLGLNYDPSQELFVLTLQRRGALTFTLEWDRDVSTWEFKLQVRPDAESPVVLMELAPGDGISPGDTNRKAQFHFTEAKTSQTWRQASFDIRVRGDSAIETIFLSGVCRLEPTVTQ